VCVCVFCGTQVFQGITRLGLGPEESGGVGGGEEASKAVEKSHGKGSMSFQCQLHEVSAYCTMA